MKILGIDPGFDKLGYAFLELEGRKIKKVASGLIKTNPNLFLHERIKEIFNRLEKLFREKRPAIVVMEDLFLFKNKKTVINVAQIQGLILLLASQNEANIMILSPLQIKKAITGYGKADKKSVEKMLYLTLPLEKRKREDDETDAIACALAGFYLLKSNNMMGKF